MSAIPKDLTMPCEVCPDAATCTGESCPYTEQDPDWWAEAPILSRAEEIQLSAQADYYDALGSAKE